MNTLTKQDNVPTPRTDAEEELLGGLWYVLADFARELERELAEATARAAAMERLALDTENARKASVAYAEKLEGALRVVRRRLEEKL